VVSATPWRGGRSAPRLGEHTREVLRECGCTAAHEETSRAAAQGVS
jgi:crotonobetainyl-CoA:carnitine CoA-transferase CaiB-like acyl-CoA transferase